MRFQKVLFVHDGPMLQNEEKTVCYGVHYTDALVSRYNFLGEEVTFLVRSRQVNKQQAAKYSKISHPSFRFVEVPNYKSIRTMHRKRAAIQIIRNEVKMAEVIILRMPSANATVAYHVAKELNKPFIVEMVACVFDALWNYDWRGKLLAYYKYWSYKKIIKESPYVIYVTSKFLQGRYPTNGMQLACSDVILKEVGTDVLEKRLNRIMSSIRPIKIITVAAIDVPYKGQADVIKVLSQCNSENFEYWIVGQGNPEKLQREIESRKLRNIKILGSVKHDEVFELMQQADLYIQPSRQEGLPRAVVEAMSVALPILGTDIAGIPELLPEECIYNPNKLENLKSILLSLNKEQMKNWSIVNHNKSTEFASINLDNKRKQFYENFLNSIAKEE
jgi:glycosyltransferase involved in cell wall biosynthesis